MVTQNNSTTVQDLSTVPGLLGAKVIYIHAEPSGYSPMIEEGEVVEAYEHRGQTQIKIQPSNKRLIAKWRTVNHIVSYTWDLPAAGAQ